MGCTRIDPWWMCGRCGERRTRKKHVCNEEKAAHLAVMCEAAKEMSRAGLEGGSIEGGFEAGEEGAGVQLLDSLFTTGTDQKEAGKHDVVGRKGKGHKVRKSR